MTAKEIIEKMDAPSKEDQDLITKAFAFAEKIHTNHKRYSGEPYLVHLFETGKNLAELGMGAATIAAGLLHDSLEDAGAKEEDIQKEFGPEILFLIQGVTKLGKLKYRGAKRHTESLRKLFVAMSQDIRVLIIKLTDRLHNMQTLQYVPPLKQKRIALETLEVYAPIAYRLGMRKLNRELEDLAFPFVFPEEYAKTEAVLRKKNKETAKPLEKVLNSIKKALAKSAITDFKTDFRVKGLYSLHKKLVRKDMDIEKVYDIAAIRIIVPTVADCYKVLGIIHSSFRPLPGRIKDYIAFPKPNGYRSIHTTVFTGDGGIIEVQIRTEEMQRESEYGIASHLSYKDDNGKKARNANILWIMSLLRPQILAQRKPDTEKFVDVPQWIKHLAKTELSNEPDEYIETLKSDFFGHRVFVFTPKGDVIDLPSDSSPIDFAYAIHSDIGNHISGVKLNGKLVTLDTKLKNGDIVEIVTKEKSKPSSKWLELVKTTEARRHIKNILHLG